MLLIKKDRYAEASTILIF